MSTPRDPTHTARVSAMLLFTIAAAPYLFHGIFRFAAQYPPDTVPSIFGPQSFRLALVVTGFVAIGSALVDWLAYRRKWLLAIIGSLPLVLATMLHPMSQIAADGFFGRPHAERLKRRADEVELLGKNFDFVVAQLGLPRSVKSEAALVVSRDMNLTPAGAPHTRLQYMATRFIPFGTYFLVFLDAEGRVSSYRVKWERVPQRDWRAP